MDNERVVTDELSHAAEEKELSLKRALLYQLSYAPTPSENNTTIQAAQAVEAHNGLGSDAQNDAVNSVVLPENSRLIPLTQGKFAIVDAEDYERTARYKWHAKYDKTVKTWYAMRHHLRGEAVKRGAVMMHRFLMDAPPGVHVDHKDGDGLNNRRSTNLRLATPSQNGCNRGLPRNNKSGYKGVSLHKACGKWVAQIKLNGHKWHLGCFSDKQAAAQAYRDAAIRLHGEFANLGQPQEAGA